MCTPYLLVMHLLTHWSSNGVGAYPPEGGADIYSENSPLVSASGFMISLSSRFNQKLSLLFSSAGV